MQKRQASNSSALQAALLVASLAAFAYRGALTSDFTGGDTLALIEVSRIHSIRDLATVLTQPMLPIITKFYRPTAALSYAIDHWTWGLDARGFHITDVVIHAITSALIVLLVHRWSKNSLAAFLAGATFALHPILMETVPNSTRRQDMLAGMLMLASLIALPRFELRRPRAWAWIPALAFCGVAMGAKEGSVVFPVLVFAWALFVLPAGVDRGPRWKSALRIATPFLALAFVFVAVRSVILGGAGGNEYSWRWNQASIATLGENTVDFCGDLIYPLRVLFHPYLNGMDRALALAAAVGFFCLIPALTRWWNSANGGGSAKLLLRSALFLCASLLLFPTVSFWIRGVIEQAYRNEAWPMIAGLIETPRRQPVEFYVWKAFDLARLAATGALLILGVVLVIVWRRRRPVPNVATSAPRWMMFCLLWMTLHLALFLAVQRYHAWNAYVPTIPFCCWLGLAISRSGPSSRLASAAACGLMLWLAAYSPLLRDLDVWTANGKFNSMMMSEVARIAAEVPAGSTLEFHDLPNLNFSWHEHGPEPTSAFTFNPASAASWVKIVQPAKQLAVDVKSQKPAQFAVAAIRLDWELAKGKRILVRGRTFPSAPRAAVDTH